MGRRRRGLIEVRARSLLFRVTAIVVFLQIALGGLLTFGFITPTPHIITGFVVLALAVATMAIALVSKPSFRPIQGLSVGLVVLLVVQIILGFVTLGSGSQLIAWVHLVNAIAIYGMAVAGGFMAMRWDHISRGRSEPAGAEEADRSR
jgi:heme A synthase